ncbi:MAG: hypothetical protein ACP5KI_00280 [Brevinematia bacterium]
MKRFFVFFVCFFISVLAFSQVNFSSFDPSRKWKVVKTKYFEIYFPKGTEYFVGKLISICDNVYENLSSKVGVRFSYRFPIVVSDQSDFANGYYSPIPWPNIVLYTSSLSRYEDFNFDDDLKGIFTHELTHALVSEEANGVMSIFRFIFGYYVVPNLFLPGIFIESITVLNESLWGFGRLNNPIFRDEIYSQIFYNNFRNFYKSSLVKNFPIDTWYLYGGMFFSYLMQKYGYDKVINFYKENTYYLPNAFYFSFFKTFGRDVFSEWEEFRQSLSSKVSNLEYLNKLKRLSFEGYYKNDLKYYNGFLFYQQSTTIDRLPSLRYLNLKTGKVRDLMYNRYIWRFDINDGIMAFIEREGSKYYTQNKLKLAKIYIYGDSFGIKDEIALPITGVYDVAMKDKNTIYVIVGKNLSNEIGVYDIANRNYRVVLSNGEVLYKNIGLYKSNLIVVISDRGKDKILVLNENDYKVIKEIDDFNLMEGIDFHNDKILFSAQNGDKMEVFEYDIKSDSIKLVASSIFSLIKPVEVDGKIFCISFSEDGYDIFSIDKIEKGFSKFNSVKLFIDENMKSITSSYISFRSEDYSFFNNMSLLRALMTFSPIIGFSSDNTNLYVNKLGVFFNFYDEPLEFRNYYVSLDWNFDSRALDYMLSFSDSSIPYFLWGFTIFRDYYNLPSFIMNSIGYKGGLYTFDYFKLGVRGNLGSQFLSFYPFLYFSILSYNERNIFDNFFSSYDFRDSDKGFVSPYLTLGLSVSTLSRSLGAITSEEGIFFNFNTKIANDFFDSQKNFVLFSWYFSSHSRIWANNVFEAGISLRNILYSNLDKGFSYGGFYYNVFIPIEEGNKLEVNLLSYGDYGEFGNNYVVIFSKLYFKLFELNEGIWPLYITSFWTEFGINGGSLFNVIDDFRNRVFRFESSIGVFFSLNLIGALENKIGVEVRYNFDNSKTYLYPVFNINLGF